MATILTSFKDGQKSTYSPKSVTYYNKRYTVTETPFYDTLAEGWIAEGKDRKGNLYIIEWKFDLEDLGKDMADWPWDEPTDVMEV